MSLNAPEFAPEVRESESPERRITVLRNLPHVGKFGNGTMWEMVYGCMFPVEVGDSVLCPPTPRSKSWDVGIVTSLTGGSYTGPIKYVGKVNPL